MSLDFILPFIFFSFVLFIISMQFLSMRYALRKHSRNNAEIILKMEEIAKSLGFHLNVSKELQNEKVNHAALANMPPFISKLILKFVESFPTWRIEGDLSNGSIKIYHEERRSGKNNKTYTIIEMIPKNPLPFQLQISKQGFFDTIGIAIFKAKDIIIGNEKFDSMFRIQGEDESSIKSLLKDSERQNALIELFKFEDYFVNGDKIYFGIEGQLTELQEFRKRIEKMEPVLSTLYKDSDFSTF